MNLVEFPIDLSQPLPPQYPAEGLSAFNKTEISSNGLTMFGEYTGSDGTLTPYTGPWPIDETVYRTEVTGGELVGLFDSIRTDIWSDVENSDNAEAIKFREAIGRNLNRRFDLSHPLITSAFSKMVLGGIATQQEIDIINLGVEE